jgi:hypothetical protein
MSTFTNTYAWDMSAGTNFATLMGAIDSNIQSFGWQLSGDTGQTDPSGASYPGLNTDAGYRIYNTNDGGTTVYMKILYGVAASVTIPRLTISLGTGTNGSGTLTGNTISGIAVAHGSANTGTHRLYMSGTSGRLMVYLGDSNGVGNQMAGISIHRTVNSSGAGTNTGVALFYVISSAVFGQQYFPLSGTVPSAETSWICAFTKDSSNIVGSTTMTGHPVTWDASGAHYPTPAVALGGTSDFTTGSPGNTTTITLYSASRTFLITAQVNAIGSSNNHRSLFLYD